MEAARSLAPNQPRPHHKALSARVRFLLSCGGHDRHDVGHSPEPLPGLAGLGWREGMGERGGEWREIRTRVSFSAAFCAPAKSVKRFDVRVVEVRVVRPHDGDVEGGRYRDRQAVLAARRPTGQL